MTATDRLELGVHGGVSFADYLALPYVSRSFLWDMADRSPAYAIARKNKPEKETDAMALGTAIHTALLEPERYEAEYATGPDVKLNTNAGKAKWAEAQELAGDRTLLRSYEGATIAGIRRSLVQQTEIRAMLEVDASYEVTVIFDCPHTGIRCKARMDAVGAMPWGHYLLDVKSTTDARPWDFTRSVRKYGYHLQAAFYRQAWKSATGEDSPFYFLCTEKSGNFGVALYELDPADLRAGEALHRRTMEAFVECNRTGRWPGYPDGLQTLPRFTREDPSE